MAENKIKVGKDDGEGIELTTDGNRVFLSGQWKGRTSKSKKGNWNISWHSKVLFDELVAKYSQMPDYDAEVPKEEEF